MLIMENSEEVLQILERFTKLKQKDIPKELEDYLSYVAKTGDTVYRWASIKYLFREKLMHVIKDFHDSSPSVDDLPQYPNVDPFNYENMKSALLERLELFNAAPFTIQRLCELLTDPRKQYARIDKYMRALEKNILVVSTVEPGRKQSDNENGDSLDSVVIEDLSLESLHVDIDMDNDNIFSMQSQQNSSHGNLSIINQDSTNNSTTAGNNSSGNNETTSSTSKNEDENGPASKKLKLDVTTDDSLDGKSKSESESDDTSDDSDSLDEKECSKEEQQSDGEKSTTDSAETEKSESNSITESDIKLQEENEESTTEREKKELSKSDLDENVKPSITVVETATDETISDHQASATASIETNLQETNEELDVTSTVSTTDSNNLNSKELNETSLLDDKNSEKKYEKELEVDEVNKKNLATSLDKELEQTVKENAENIPDVSTESNQSDEEVKTATEVSSKKDDHKEKENSTDENIPSTQPEKEEGKVIEVQEEQKVESSLIDETYVDNSLPVTDKINTENNFPLDDSKTVSTVETVTIPESISTVTDKMKEEEVLLSKVPEQMSVEEQTPQTATHMISENQHLLEQQQNPTDTILSTNSPSSSMLLSASSNSILTHGSSPSNPTIIDNKMQMDEHVDSGISISETSTTCTLVNINPIDDEVVMQSENEMATDPIKMTEDKVNDLTGMDIDDTSQEEAMDQ